MTNVNLKSLIGEVAVTVPFHFTIKIEGLRIKGVSHGVLHGMEWITFHSLPDFALSPPQRGGSQTKPGDHGTSKSQPLILSNSLFRRTHMNRMGIK